MINAFKNRIITKNFDAKDIPVEFVVIHYTGGNWHRVKELFENPNKEISAHLVISEKGEVDEVVPCLDGHPLKAWHAGVSMFNENGKSWDKFNNFSIGIELVNLNGNIFDYSNQQYLALIDVLLYLKTIFPKLNDPQRILGHEHIAGFRGKADPGINFNWEKIYQCCYPSTPHSFSRTPIIPKQIAIAFSKFSYMTDDNDPKFNDYWHAVNFAMEQSLKYYMETLKLK